MWSANTGSVSLASNTAISWVGDMFDSYTSPNDPVFFFHHANIDRFFMTFEGYNYDSAPYFGYPTTGYSTGGNLDDTVGLGDPVPNPYTGLDYTIKDVFDYLGVLNAPFTFQSILNLKDKD
jgi:hypothetical protein